MSASYCLLNVVVLRIGEPQLKAIGARWSGQENGHVISWQRRDVNLPPDPILKLMAVASCRSLYIIQRSMQGGRLIAPRPSHEPNARAARAGIVTIDEGDAGGFEGARSRSSEVNAN